MELKFWAFIYGSLIGSFLNVLIYRIPRHLDLVFKRSACPKCDYTLQWYNLFPILSYLFQRGKCSNCHVKISMRYPVVELISALLATYLMPTSLNLNNFLYFLFFFSSFCIFLVHFFIDIDFKILPDSLNLILGILFLIFALIHFEYRFWLVGGLVGFLFPLAVTWIFYKIKGQIGLGGGDIKLYGILGVYLGAEGVLKNIFVSCFLGAVVGITLISIKKLDKNDPIAFGPFIILVAIFQIYFPEVFSQVLSVLP